LKMDFIFGFVFDEREEAEEGVRVDSAAEM